MKPIYCPMCGKAMYDNGSIEPEQTTFLCRNIYCKLESISITGKQKSARKAWHDGLIGQLRTFWKNMTNIDKEHTSVGYLLGRMFGGEE